MVAECTYLPGLGTHRAPSRSCFAVPVIGFVHGHSAGPNSLNSAAFARRPGEACVEGRKVRGEHLGAKDYHDRLPKVIDYAAAAIIVMAVAFGPVAWLITG